MKDRLITLGVALILLFAIYNAWNDNTEQHNHAEFFNIMKEFKVHTEVFMNRGGRNTSTMGKQLCERVNELEAKQNVEQVDCDGIYK